MNNPIISVVGLGKMGLGIYKRLFHENIILYGYDNNSKIIKNNTYINFLEIEKLLELSDLVLFVVPSNDEIFDIIEKYELKKCLNNVTEEINLSSFDFKLTAENITSQGLEFNTKYVGSLTLEVSSLDKLIPIQKMRMNTTNYISSNMADEEKKRIKSLMLIDICETIKTHVN